MSERLRRMSMLAKRNNIEKKSEKDHKVDLVKFSDVEQVYNRIAYNGKQTITVVCTGTTWSYVARKTLETLQKTHLEACELLCLDQDDCDEFCLQQGIVVGSPATMFYHDGNIVTIQRRRSKIAGNFYHGQLNEDSFKDLVEAVKEAVAANEHNVKLAW